MKSQRDINNNKKSQTAFIWSLLVGTTTLFVGLAIGLTLRTPTSTSSVVREHPASAPESHIAASVADTQPPGQPVVTMIFDPPLAEAEAEAEKYSIESVAADNADLDESEPDAATQARRAELQYLQEVLPDNLMIPTDKSPAEVEALFAEFEEHQHLQQRIESGHATQEERHQYYELRMRKFDEEIALIQLCNDVAANALDTEDERQSKLCSHMAQSSEERLQIINDSIQELEQQVLFTSRNE